MVTLSMIPGHRGHGQHGVEDQITCSCHGVSATHMPGQWHKLVLHPTAWLCVLPRVPQPGAAPAESQPTLGGQQVTPEL